MNDSMEGPLNNVVVVGGSYVGKAAAQKLAQIIPSTHRVLLIESHTHFHHLFTFPRFAIIPGHEHKAFIPYFSTFSSTPSANSHAIIPARVLAIESHSLKLDREWQGSDKIAFEYLVVATGTTLTQPSTVGEDAKLAAIEYLRRHQQQVKLAKSLLIVGGGAAGVQMATDLKEYYPEKLITVAQSRQLLMPKFDSRLHGLIKKRFDELGINLVTGARVIVPTGGYPTIRTPIDVQFTNGSVLSTEFVILATGQQPNNTLVAGLESSDGIINPENGMIRVRPTLQFADPQYQNLFAVGDIADTGAHKAARPGVVHAGIVAANILALIQGRKPEDKFSVSPAGIHMSLGLKYNILFVNPNPAEGQIEPKIVERYDGREDMGVDSMWQRMGIHIRSADDYNL